MLKIQDIHVYYGAIHAVKGVSFQVNQREIVALIGANGAGKSTILKTISGLMHPRSGSISFMDQDITHTDAYKLVRHGLAHVPEGRRIFLQMSVQENLEMGAFTQKEVSKEDLERVYTLFPRLMMLDEPSMGLAPILVDQIFDIIRELHKAGTTILLVEQNASKALEIADRAYVLETGTLTLSGTGAELISSDEVRKAYLGG